MKALERQAGAQHVELDTEGQWVTAYFVRPQTLKLAGFKVAAEAAAYEILEMTIAVQGEVVEQDGTARLRVDATGQFLPLSGDSTVGASGRLRGQVKNWGDADPGITLDPLGDP